ncbi:sugar ABC transporter permease [Arsenicitalea aurantiaca]|uniref:Sugar ABC transporter permease n=1 Tax=Arsenicitalea aurantiaca TaxID=1783274 RepID=A0A433XL37_9HYPH|nr:sugar ABC transporter permease [Arsenicitalea aurantiaca]RUT34797.1 sugar ABC transporter permease [Arsenicitalea aurantiaca]
MFGRVGQYLLISPVHLLLIAFILVPSLYVGWLSFHSATFGGTAEFVGFANYLTLLGDRNFWRASLNTFVIVNLIVYIELALGLAIALLFARGVPMTKVMVAIVLLPYAVSEVVAIVMWRYVFDPSAGIVNLALQGMGLPIVEWAINPTHALGLVVLISVWQNLPFTFILIYTARLGLPKDIYEAADLDGGSPWKIFRHVTIPLLMPAIMVAVMFRYIFAFRIFSEVWLLTEGGPARMTEVLAVYLYRSAFRYHDFGVASATGWAMVLLSFAIAALYLRAMYRRMFT